MGSIPHGRDCQTFSLMVAMRLGLYKIVEWLYEADFVNYGSGSIRSPPGEPPAGVHNCASLSSPSHMASWSCYRGTPETCQGWADACSGCTRTIDTNKQTGVPLGLHTKIMWCLPTPGQCGEGTEVEPCGIAPGLPACLNHTDGNDWCTGSLHPTTKYGWCVSSHNDL